MLIETISSSFQFLHSVLIDGQILIPLPGQPNQYLIFEAVHAELAVSMLEAEDPCEARCVCQFDQMSFHAVDVVIVEDDL